MRETLFEHTFSPTKPRITPAYAGNTYPLTEHHHRRRDHPRVCGKHTDFDFQLLDQQGSPPRMRETPLCDIFRPRPDRITPAYAGNTIFSTQGADWGEDHPRVCGKHLDRPALDWRDTGSPPRMRETHEQGERTNEDYRITPAYAGNTGTRKL